MLAITGKKQESINFSAIPWFTKDMILEKMNYKTYGNFVQTGRLAESLASAHRNRHIKYHMNADSILILETNAYVNYKGQWTIVSYEECQKIRFPVVDIRLNDSRISKEACNFLRSLEKIHTIYMVFPEVQEPHLADFFKEANIETLMIKTRLWGYDEDQAFPYDTSRIGTVEIHDCSPLSAHDLFSFKAARHLSLTRISINRERILQCIQERIEGKTAIDLSIYDYATFHSELTYIMDFVLQNAVNVEKDTFAFTRENEDKPFMTMKFTTYRIEFRGCCE